VGVGEGSLSYGRRTVASVGWFQGVPAAVALGVTAGALTGSRILPYANVRWLRMGFVVILILIAVEMGWRAMSGI
jgi:uncharacterized membrane protein YfcA